jgi:hypothetical protein
MGKKLKEETRSAHPGWSVQTKDGHWLGGAHGWFLSEDAFYADIYDSEEDAKHWAESNQSEFAGGFEYNIVPAWQPLCERFRVEISSLREANAITPSKIMDIVMSLEDAISTLQGK